jgi:hypothetical protein
MVAVIGMERADIETACSCGSHIQKLDDSLPHNKPGLPFKLAPILIQAASIVKDVDHRQLVALAGGKVVGVMRRRNLDGSGSKGHVHKLCVLHAAALLISISKGTDQASSPRVAAYTWQHFPPTLQVLKGLHAVLTECSHCTQYSCAQERELLC